MKASTCSGVGNDLPMLRLLSGVAGIRFQYWSWQMKDQGRKWSRSKESDLRGVLE